MFLLKKIISAFFMPVSLGLFMFALGMYFLFRNQYSKAKIVLFLTLSWFALVSFQPVSNALLKPLENSYDALINPPLDVKYIYVLGSGHNENKNISITSQMGMTANTRLNEGIRLYKILKEFHDVKLIVSGAKSFDNDYSHAFMSREHLKALGINENDIIKVDNAKDTHDESLEALKIVTDNKMILVTSASHMKRSMALFINQGVNVIAAPTNHLVYESRNFNSYFSALNLYKTKLAFHEYLGILWNKIKGILS